MDGTIVRAHQHAAGARRPKDTERPDEALGRSQGGLVIPRQKRERRTRFDKAAYRQRSQVERLVGHFKQSRRIATRYEKRAIYYLGMLTIASIIFWL